MIESTRKYLLYTPQQNQSQPAPRVLYRNIIKPIFDTTIALILLLLLSPVFLVLSTLIYIQMGGPIFFTQKRIGYKNKLFTIYKFRSMTSAVDENGRLLPEDQRITRLGRFIRSKSLDELPQLFNVVKGNLSIIGPRPLLPQYLSLYNEKQIRRHDVLPGITGLAQINGRNRISWEEKFDWDVAYAQNCSFFLDLEILFKTIFKDQKPEFETFSEYFQGSEIRDYPAALYRYGIDEDEWWQYPYPIQKRFLSLLDQEKEPAL